MMKTVVWFVMFFVVGIAMLGGVAAVLRVFNPGPLLLTPDEVAGAWPFRAEALEVSCCVEGRVSLVSETGQAYWFVGARHADRFPVAALAHAEAEDGDFEAVRTAARRLARTHWPDLVQ